MAADNKSLGTLHPGRHPAGAARRAADRGDLRHRRQRHPERLGEGQGDRQGAEDRHPGRLRPVQGRDRADGPRGRGARRRGPRSGARRSRCATAPTAWPTRPRRRPRERRQAAGRAEDRGRGEDQGAPGRAQGERHPEDARVADRAPGRPEPGRPGGLHGGAGRGRCRRGRPGRRAGRRSAGRRRPAGGGTRPGTVEGEFREV